MYLSGLRARALGLWIDIQCSILLPSSNGSQFKGCCVWRAVIQFLYPLASTWLQLMRAMATTWWQLDHIDLSPNGENSALFSWEHVLKAGKHLPSFLAMYLLVPRLRKSIDNDSYTVLFVLRIQISLQRCQWLHTQDSMVSLHVPSPKCQVATCWNVAHVYQPTKSLHYMTLG